MKNDEKSRQLGMPFGTAQHQLRKIIMFDLLRQLKQNVCFQCGGLIETVDNLSIEHKEPWLHGSITLFWDLNNIAFSHLSCNVKAQRHWNASKTECKNGHAFTSENTLVHNDRRKCRQCTNDCNRDWMRVFRAGGV